MKQPSLQTYFQMINQMITDTEETGASMNPYYKEIREAMDQNQEVSAETLAKVYTQFETGVEKYEQLFSQLERVNVPVKLMGLHKQLVAAYRHYFDACQEMLKSVNPDQGLNVEQFEQSEKDQDTYSNKITSVIGRMTAGLMR